MKKFFLTLALAFAGIMSANAQLWLGGSTSVHAKDGFNMSLAPEIGYSFSDSPITVAAAFNFMLGSSELTGTAFELGISPYVRCNLATVEKFNFFLDLTGDIFIPDFKELGWRIGLQPGIAWNATEHWTVASRIGFLGYNNSLMFNDGDQGFVLGFQSALPSLGLYYNF